MSKKRACKICKVLSEANECPRCKKNSFANSWQGRINIIDVKGSEIANKIGVKENGEYAIKIR